MSDIKSIPSFEDYGQENGIKYWWASLFSDMLGYSTYSSFMNPINRAIKACMSAGIDHFEDFQREQRIVDGQSIDDIRLSRFACYMVAMNADIKKPQVARAQVYFADQVEKINLILEGRQELDRLQIREDIKISNKELNSIAKKVGVRDFGLFHHAGYRGMYNRGIREVKQMKGIDEKKDHFDFMGRTELAANLFRITLTEEKLKKSPRTVGESVARNVHKTVGSKVRKMVIDNTGKAPENLPIERRLTEVKKELKKASKALNKPRKQK